LLYVVIHTLRSSTRGTEARTIRASSEEDLLLS